MTKTQEEAKELDLHDLAMFLQWKKCSIHTSYTDADGYTVRVIRPDLEAVFVAEELPEAIRGAVEAFNHGAA